MNALFVAWRPPSKHEGWRPIGRLEHRDGLFRFSYTQGSKKPGFRAFAQMEALDQVYESEELFPVFANRLLSKSRPEYEDFLRWGGFDAADTPDPVVILGVTEGLRQTDAIEVFPCPQPDMDGCYLSKFFLHGIRWFPDSAHERILQLKSHERLKLLPDVQNEYDNNAVAVRTELDRVLIGYIPRYLAQDVSQLLTTCAGGSLELFVDRLNSDAPLQNRVLCRMHACWPDDFVPCASEDFQPLVSDSLSKSEP